MNYYQFYLHNQLYPESPTYNIPSLFRIHGELDVMALRESIDHVLSRHDVFRMTFSSGGGRLRIETHDHARCHFPEINRIDDAEDPNALSRHLDEEIARPFDLATGPLIRCRLFELHADHFVLLVVMHHCITDLHSKELLGKQISAAYAALTQTGNVAEQEPGSDYAACLKRQQQWIATSSADKMRRFWKRELEDAEGLIQLPLDHPRPAFPESSGRAVFFQLDDEKTGIMRNACRRYSIAPFVAMLACYLILLSRYCRQERIVIGVPLSNRRNEQDKDTLGCFVNILPLAFELKEDTTIMQAIGMVRMKMLLAHRYQELPFHEIVAAVKPQREPSHNPIFQVGFTYEPPMELDLTGLTVTSEKCHNRGAQMDLFLNVFEMAPGIQGYFEYDQALFDKETVERMAAHYRALISSWSEKFDQPIDRVDLLSAREKETILQKWNATRVDYGEPKCFNRLFERQAAETPSLPAVVYNETVLTYREFNERANQLAHFIIARGGGAENIVAVFMERSIEMVVALHGIVKAGAAYLPLEPDLPEQRLAFILEESRADLLLTQKALQKKLPAFSGTVACLDAEWTAISTYPLDNPVDTATADNLAYVIYTSGSTGKPKGVMVEHKSIFNRLMWMQDAYNLQPGDRVLQKTPFGFDVSVWEFFWPLMTGATLVVAPPDAHRDPVRLCQVIQKQEITTIHFVPSMLRIFLQVDEAAGCSSLKRVFCSGEALIWSLRNAFLERLDGELHNLYGPTEAAVDVSYWDCRSEMHPGKVPIGYPVANTQLYILDKYLKPVPQGVVGDLYIGGIQVARGYLRRDAVTRKRFVSDPFDPSPGSRLNNTGDLARHLPDGAIEYVGRTDFQVKLFGNRIELAEIEAALRSHPEISDAAVTLAKGDPERQQLVAYVLTDIDQVDDLQPRKYLLERLPYYMVPNHYHLMSSFPLTASGKIDRKQLPEDRIQPCPSPVSPADQQEGVGYLERIAGLWQRILDDGDVDVECNFFDAGGSSMQVAELSVAIEEKLGILVPIVKVFQYPTVSALAEFVEEKANR